MATDGEENGRREKIAGNGERSGVADEMPGNGGAGNRAADERGGTVGGERCASVARNMTDDGLAVYIHFPYCRSRCPYCDFSAGYCRASLTRRLWFRATAKISPILLGCAEKCDREGMAGA